MPRAPHAAQAATPMWRTALACGLLAVLAWASARWLTHDFQVWTAEGARRLEVAQQPVPAPRIAVDGPGMAARPLHDLLTQERAVTVVDFIYTRCVTVCLSLGTMFQQMQASIAAEEADGAPGRRAPLRLLSISFDPAHDDPTVLGAYAAGLRADPRIWRFARAADLADLPALLARYQVTVVRDEFGGYEHNAALLVVDAGGRLVHIFDYDDLDTALAYARALAG